MYSKKTARSFNEGKSKFEKLKKILKISILKISVSKISIKIHFLKILKKQKEKKQ
jgi:predicted metalloenzyme YecM